VLASLSKADRRALPIDLAEWLESGPWRDLPEAEQSIVGFARKALSSRYRAILKGSCHLASLSDEARHEIRIRAKKLRYAAEMLESLFPKRGRRRFLKRCEKLQSALGALNDVHSARDLALGLAQSEARPASLERQGRIGFALGWKIGRREATIPVLVAKAQKARNRFRKAHAFR
jgi:CHAD domain-containing protein